MKCNDLSDLNDAVVSIMLLFVIRQVPLFVENRKCPTYCLSRFRIQIK